MSNGIERFWGDGRLPFAPASDRLYDGPPKLGLVIGTYAAVPYVHLQLEARRRLYPGVPTLVHDDASPATDRLRGLCDEYGCDFETNSSRLPHHLGDLSVYVGGLKWAERQGVELLLKLSRRWIFLTDWTGDLQALAMDSQNPTFSNYTKSYAFGFRTECFGINYSGGALQFNAAPVIIPHNLNESPAQLPRGLNHADRHQQRIVVLVFRFQFLQFE